MNVTETQRTHSAGAGSLLPNAFSSSSTRRLASESVLKVYGRWQPPDEEEAKQKYHATHIQHDTFEHGAELRHFKEFGAGHLLYFYFLRLMAGVFTGLVGLSALIMIIFNAGGGFIANASDFEATTIGNFGLPSSNNDSSTIDVVLPTTNRGADAELAILSAFQEWAYMPAVTMSSLHINKLNALVAASVLDMLGILAYFAACIYLILRTKHIAAEVDQQVVSLPDYTLQVQGLPGNTEPDELTKYFEQWGDVVQVECARRCHVLVSMVMERKQILDELDLAIATLQKAAEAAPEVDEALELEVLNLRYDLSLLTEAIRARQLTRNNDDVVRAYVTFKDDLARDAALEAQPRSAWHRWRQPLELRFRGRHALYVRPAPEVTDIQFENLEFSELNRWAARLATWICKALLVVFGFVLVSLAPSIKRSVGALSDMPSISECNSNCAWKNAQGALYLNDTMRVVYRKCYDTGVYANAVSCQGAVICYECFCKTALSRSMYEETSYCSEFRIVLVQAVGAQALTVFSIVAVNMAVQLLIQRLCRLELHRTRTREGSSMVTALFLTQFINTAFSTLIANMYLPHIQDALPSEWRTVLFGGIYPDTTPNWYREVGKALIISHLLGIPIRMAAIGWEIWSRRHAFNTRGKALTQAQLNAAYTGHDFLLAPRYGEHLSVIFIGLVFSGGMPLMYISLALSFIAHYKIEKYELLKVCKWPNSVTPDLATLVANILPFAAPCHLLGAAWMFSMIGTPRSALIGDSWLFNVLLGINKALKRVWENTNQLKPNEMAARFSSRNTAHLMYAVVLLTLFLIIFFSYRTWVALYTAIRHAVTKHGDRADRVVPVHGVPEFTIAVRSQLIVGPTSYDMRSNPNYAHAFERLEDHVMTAAEMERVEKQEGPPRNVRDKRRRERREQARLVLRTDVDALAAVGQAGEHAKRLATADAEAAHLKSAQPSSNQVMPWEGAGDPLDDKQAWSTDTKKTPEPQPGAAAAAAPAFLIGVGDPGAVVGQGPEGWDFSHPAPSQPWQGSQGGAGGGPLPPFVPHYAHMALPAHQQLGGEMARPHGTRLNL